MIVDFEPIVEKNNASVAAASVRAVRDGLELIERSPERPRFWSDAALRKAKELAEIVPSTTGGVQQVNVTVDSSRSIVTRRTSVNVDALIGIELRALGTIEGRLRAVSEGGGLHFVVQDAVTHNEVRCYIKDEDTDKILAAFRKRVAVYGEIQYRRDRQPASIAVEHFRMLREKESLPTAADVRGILA